MSRLPISYLPGGGGRSSFWRPVADRLWRYGAPVVFGYPGFGDAPTDPGIVSLSGLYDALLSVLPDRFHLVAQSMGNVLALRIAIEKPERIASLVLCAVSGGVDVRRLGGAEWRTILQAEQPIAPTWFIEDESDFTEKLASIHIPTLLLFGDSDPLSPVRVGEFLRDNLPQAQLHVVTGGSHTMAHEEPDRIASVIAGFLTRSSPSAMHA
jgi:pimeloyl-ACP methyl ester carboxylesterase